jgi:phosphoribosylglycinamide formyltransferase-1
MVKAPLYLPHVSPLSAKKNILLFASGSGSNAENICRYFEHHPTITVAALFCNKPDAAVIGKMKPFGIPVHLINRQAFNDPEPLLQVMKSYRPAAIVLAGFLWLVPQWMTRAFPGKIINIHPALLPKFGGKGMYGDHVHRAVLDADETEHGITIHFVNEQYDEGEPLFQEKFTLTGTEDLQAVKAQISALELAHFPRVIEKLLQTQAHEA